MKNFIIWPPASSHESPGPTPAATAGLWSDELTCSNTASLSAAHSVQAEAVRIDEARRLSGSWMIRAGSSSNR